MSLIKSAYNVVISYQIIQMIIFLYFFLENGLFVEIPIAIYINSDFNFSTTIDFNIGSLIAFVLVVTLIIIVAGIQAVGSGLNDTATQNLKQIIGMIALSTILGFPTFYIFGLSEYLVNYAVFFNFVCFLVYVMYFLSNKEGN